MEHKATINFIPTPPPPPPPPPLLHSETAVRCPAFTACNFLINIFFWPSLFQPFRPSIHPACHLSIRLFTCLPTCTLLRSRIILYVYIHTHGDLTLWIPYTQNFVEVSLGCGISRKNTLKYKNIQYVKHSVKILRIKYSDVIQYLWLTAGEFCISSEYLPIHYLKKITHNL